MTPGSLLVPVGTGLTFRFERLPEPLRLRVEKYLAYFLHQPFSPGSSPIRVSAEPPGKDPSQFTTSARGAAVPTTLLEEPPLVVRQVGNITQFEMPGILAWCSAAEARGGICLERASETDLDLFVGLALAPMLIELAISRNWLAIHAAAVTIDGIGILLPGPSGAGKSTIFSQVHRAGHPVLSDDLVWIAPLADDPRLVAFPRGSPTESVPWPTTSDVALRAIICPEIAADGASSCLTPLALPELLEVLLGQGGFLSPGAAAGDRFRALVRLAQSVPGYRLEAGRKRQEVPTLLARLAADLADQARPRNSRSALRIASGRRLASDPRRREENK